MRTSDVRLANVQMVQFSYKKSYVVHNNKIIYLLELQTTLSELIIFYLILLASLLTVKKTGFN